MIYHDYITVKKDQSFLIENGAAQRVFQSDGRLDPLLFLLDERVSRQLLAAKIFVHVIIAPDLYC